MKKTALLTLTTLIAISLSACSGIGANAWEKGRLARDDMAMKPNINDIVDDHIYYSKEGVSGGRGFGGGGCGCN